MPRSLRQRKFDEQNGLCWLCGKPMSMTTKVHPLRATFDHVKPRAHGGTRDPSNLKLAHQICNNRRGTSDPRLPQVQHTNAVPFSYAWLCARGYITG